MGREKLNVSRRNLVKGAMLVPFHTVSGTAANSAVTVGLIGAGGRGTYDASILVKNKDARLVALCDIFDDRIENAKEKIPLPNPKVYKDYHKLLASDVDAVIIATPVFLHPEHFEAAVKAGKHIYIEKPAGVDVAGCKKVIHAADSADRSQNIVFGFQQRYGPAYRKGKKLFDSGGIGRIHMAHSHWIKGAVTGKRDPVPPPTTYEQKIRDWHRWRATFGDIIVETYVHGIDVLNWFLGGHALKAYGTGGRTIRRDGDNLDHVDVTFTYANNVQAALTGSQIAPRFYRSVNEQFFGATGVIETHRKYWKHYRGRDDVLFEEEPRDITVDAIEEFVRRIKDGTPENIGIAAAESTLTAIMGRMAIELKREVTWDEVMKSA